MNKRDVCAKIRRRRDLFLETARLWVELLYFIVSYVMLCSAELRGKDVFTASIIFYVSYFLLFAVEVLSFMYVRVQVVLIMITSIIGLWVQLILALPLRLLLHGIEGYAKYARHEIKRIFRMERQRIKECW